MKKDSLTLLIIQDIQKKHIDKRIEEFAFRLDQSSLYKYPQEQFSAIDVIYIDQLYTLDNILIKIMCIRE